MVHMKINHILTQFFMAFHVVFSSLLGVLVPKTTIWLAEIFQKPCSLLLLWFLKLTLAGKGFTTHEGPRTAGQENKIIFERAIFRLIGHSERWV